MTLEQFLKQNDLDFFLNKVSLAAAAKRVRAEVDGLWIDDKFVPMSKHVKLRDISAILKEDRDRECEFWGRRIKPKNLNSAVDEKYWDRLKICVSKHLHLLQGAPADVAERIVRRWMSTSIMLMNGLPERMRVWG